MKDTKKIALVGLFSAIAFVFTLVGNAIPISIQGFLKYDPKDAIVAIAGFMLGPIAALIISVITSLLELITISQTGLYGLLMNVISTASFACIASGFYKKIRTLKVAIFGLITATLVTTALMLMWNYFITPFYLHYPREMIARMLPTVFLPFNLIKYGINASIAILIYKPLVKALRKSKIIDTPKRKAEDESTGLLKENTNRSGKRLWVTIIASFVLVSLIFCFLILAGVV